MRFRRRPARVDHSSAELAALVRQGEDMISHLTEAHLAWGLGAATNWEVDQRTGLITWQVPGRTATAPVQVIGTYEPATSSWLWGWANNSIPPVLARDSRQVHDWAHEHGHPGLTMPRIEAG